MKKGNIVKIISMALIISAAVSVLSACGSNENTKKESSSSSSSAATSSEASSASSVASETSTASQTSEPSTDSNSIPEISDPTPESSGETVNGIFIYDNTAYELFYGDSDMAKNYAATISKMKKSLGSDIKVYNVIVPTHVGVTLPDKFKDLCSSQKDYIDTITSS